MQPASEARGAKCLEMDPPALNSAMSTPSKLCSVSSSMVWLSPPQSTVFPADLSTQGHTGGLLQCKGLAALQLHFALLRLQAYQQAAMLAQHW